MKMNTKELLEQYKTKGTKLVLKGADARDNLWIGKIVDVEDDFIRFKGFQARDLFESIPSWPRPRDKKAVEKSQEKLQKKIQEFVVPFSNIASISFASEHWNNVVSTLVNKGKKERIN